MSDGVVNEAPFTAYCDESGIHDESKTFVLAGLVGTPADWTNLADAWTKSLSDREARMFHASDCAGGRRDFAGWPKERREDLWKSLVESIVGTGLVGYGVAIARGNPQERTGPVAGELKNPYVVAFGDCVLGLCRLAVRLGLHDPQQVEFVFDRHSEWSNKAKALAVAMKADPELLGSRVRRVGEINFEPSVDFPGLQAADLLSYEIRKHIENRDLGIPTRRSLDRLCGGRRVEVTELDRGKLEWLATLPVGLPPPPD